MENFLLENENAIRLGVFFGIFAIMAIWEVISQKRPQSLDRLERWPHNILLVVTNTFLMRLIFPVFPVTVALSASVEGWGLFNNFDIPVVLEIILAVALLDLAIYVQHVIFHHVPFLWRLHRLHHADTEFDVTTGARFHPVEIALSLVIKMALIVALGAPAVAVIIFEIVLNGAAMFNHANISLPSLVDRVLRFVVVTPDMHRIHHSEIVAETDSNFGFNLSCWDRLFKTYREVPRHGHLGMTIGLPIFRNKKEARLDKLLTQPFRDDITAKENR
jgi:sterol desaturase/sphingolipid hydroxylase (fatty acid hydroxylase superfamily)